MRKGNQVRQIATWIPGAGLVCSSWVQRGDRTGELTNDYCMVHDHDSIAQLDDWQPYGLQFPPR